jgi:polysaccharide export outer membrane protein
MIKFSIGSIGCSKSTLQVFLSIILASALFSCHVTSRPTAYFQNLGEDTVISLPASLKEEIKILPGDALQIVVSSLNKEDDLIFNAGSGKELTVFSEGHSNGFLVGKDGVVSIHRLGKVKVAGMTISALKEKLTRDLDPYFKDLIVNVSFSNHKVTLLGDLARPQVLSLPNHPLSLLDALASVGDLNVTARRDQVMLIREEEGKQRFKRLNLNDRSFLGSEWYYLKPNDILYVPMDDEKKLQEDRRQKNIQLFSFVISSLSLIIILIDRVLN